MDDAADGTADAGQADASRPDGRRRWWWFVLITFGVLGLLGAAGGIAAHYRTPQSLYTLAISAFSPYLAFAAAVAVVLFAVARGRTGWIGLGLALAALVWSVALRAPLWVAQTAPPGHDVVVMTANLRVGGGDPSAVVAAVERHHVEVLMLEELTPEVRDALRAAGLDRVLPHSLSDPQDGGAGTGLWSRYPLSAGKIDHDFTFTLVTASTASPYGTLGLVAVHVGGPHPAPSFANWSHDMRALPATLQGQPTTAPVLAAGDFNATPDVVQFRDLLTGGFADAADQAGAGYTRTYPADRAFPPLIAIDHVLTRGAVATSVDTVEIPGSDHRALVATVRIPSG